MIRFWDVATGEPKSQIAVGDFSAQGVAYSPDGRFVATTSGIWNAETGKRVVALGIGAVRDPSYSGDGQILGMRDHQLESVHLFDPASGNRTMCFPAPYGDFAIPTNGRVLIASRGGEEPNAVRIQEMKSGKVIYRLPKVGPEVCSLTLSADERWLAIGGTDGSIVIWDFAVEWKKALGQLANVSEPKELEKRWAELAGNDALAAYRAMEAMTAAKWEAVPFLKKKVESVLQERAQIWKLVDKLGVDNYTVPRRRPRNSRAKGRRQRASSANG